ncbi:MAG: 30S ribosomal protein S6 [Candidatus Blackburnbacteria bacterium]|nr:30S ribosomal protein S6 [Candidatus Blackburnbacteria bacterium]
MGNYELTLVLSPEATDAKQKTLLAKLIKAIEAEGGKVTSESKWGRKTLAYPLKKNTEGVYFLWELELPKDKVAVRMVELEEEVLRHLLVKHEARSSKS